MDSYLQELTRTYNASPGDQVAAGRLIAALQRALGGLEVERYKPRNLPCNIAPDNQLWCITGGCENGGGVLEWCYDEDDAQHRLKLMQADPRYTELKAEKWKTRLDLIP